MVWNLNEVYNVPHKYFELLTAFSIYGNGFSKFNYLICMQNILNVGIIFNELVLSQSIHCNLINPLQLMEYVISDYEFNIDFIFTFPQCLRLFA